MHRPIMGSMNAGSGGPTGGVGVTVAKPAVPSSTGLLGMVSENTAKTHAQSWADDTTTLGRTLNHSSFYYQANETFPVADTISPTPAPANLMITWFGWPDSEVNAGTRDAAITARAQALKDLNRPTFLRWDIEMNIESYGYEPVNAYDPAHGPTFISAWQRVYNLFQAVGATNVAFCWCPNDSGPADPHGWRAFYPGDAYVDWVAVDSYNWGTSNFPAPTTVWQSFYGAAHAFIDDWKANFGGAGGAAKPLMIGESSCYDGGGSKSWWYTDALGYLRSVGCKAFTLYNTNQSSSGLNWRFDTNAAATQAFKEIVQDPYWGGTDTKGSGYAAALLADTPHAYWKFNELTGTFTDSAVGAANPATLLGTVSTRGCPAMHGGMGPSYSAYGSGYISLGTLGNFGSSMGSGFTISFLYKHGGGTTPFTLLGILNTGTTTALWVNGNQDHIGNTAGKTYFSMRNEAGVQRYTDINTNIYDENWHLIQWVCNPGGVDIIWVDGAAVTPTASVAPAVGTFLDFGFNVFVGGRSNRGSVDSLWVAGCVDELAFYKSKLTTTRLGVHATALAT